MALTNVFNLPTIATILAEYQNTVQSVNPNANPYVPRTDWYVKGQALAGIVSGAYADIAINAQNIYPQYATGNAVDLKLASLGLPARLPATYSFGTVYYTSQVSGDYPFTIPSGSTLTNTATGVVYNIYNSVTVTTPTTPTTPGTPIPFVSSVIGPGYQLHVGTVLQLSPPAMDAMGHTVSTLTVSSSTDGSNPETDAQADLRILNALQIPPAGARQTDYLNFALEGNTLLQFPEITGAIIIPQFLQITGLPAVMGIFGLAGSSMSDYLLNLGLITPSQFSQYTRTLSADGVTAIQTSIFDQKLVALNLIVATNDTWPLPLYGGASGNPVIKVIATLVPNVTLSTPITVQTTDQFGNPTTIILTAKQLIQREVRRAIVNVPFGGVIDNMGNHIIPISVIEQSLDYGLGAGNISGIYASILANRVVQLYNGTNYTTITSISVPTFLNPADGNFYGTYDFAPVNLSPTNDPYNDNVLVVSS